MISLITEGPPALWGHPLMYFFLFFTFAFGACLGSFTNVLIHRIPMDMSVVYPPSACPSCGHQIRWYENMPILSYLGLRGQCSQCNAQISFQYPFLEFLAGLWSVSLAYRELWPTFSQAELWVNEITVLLSAAALWLWLLIFTCALLAITLIDLRYTFVPDEISLNMIWFSFAAFFIPTSVPVDHFFGLLAGYGVILGIRGLGYLMYRREAMGLGDAKLLAMIGGFLGWRVLPWILFAAAVQGLMAATLAIAYTKLTGRSNILTMTSTELDERFGEESLYEEQRILLVMPFGPFLCIAAFEVLALTPAGLLHYLSLLQ